MAFHVYSGFKKKIEKNISNLVIPVPIKLYFEREDSA